MPGLGPLLKNDREGPGPRRRLSLKCLFFYRQTGLLLLGMKENAELKIIQATLSRQGVEHQCLPSEELKLRFPNIRLARGEVGLLEKSGGVLYADKALRALQVISCSIRGTAAPALGILGPHQPSPDPQLDDSLCPASFSLDFLDWAVLYTLLGLDNMGEEV